MKKLFRYLSALTLSATGCASNQGEPEKTVDQVDIQRFMGEWYVIANIPTYFEKDAANAKEVYTWNAEESRIDVDYRHHSKTPDGPLKKYPQKAWIYNHSTNAEWRVQPLWPLKFAYLVIGLAPDYAWTMIGVPDRKYVWIMSRKPRMDDALLATLKGQLKERGYDLAKLRMTPQVW